MNKRGILFTVTSVMLLISLFLLTNAFLDRTQELQRDIAVKVTAEQLAYAENDIAGNVYSELLTTVASIKRTTSTTIQFNSIQLSADLDHSARMQQYQDFIEQNYTLSNNLDISLIGFNNSFTIEPLNAMFVVNKDILYLYSPEDEINRITLNIVVSRDNETKFESVVPIVPPGIPIVVRYYDYEDDLIYDQTILMRPDHDNDNIADRQFYQSFSDGAAYIDTKFGTVNSTDGVLYISVVNLTANITSLEITYANQATAIIIKGGNVSIKANIGKMTKNSPIILAEE